MSPLSARLVVWSGAAVLAAAAGLTVLLTVAEGDKVFAARLLSGLAGCL